MTLARRSGAEFTGTALLLAIVVGSGIMGERLAAGNAALALLANALATAAGLFVLICAFASASGSHFNPLVTLADVIDRRLPVGDAAAYLGAQFTGAILGVAAAHEMFELPVLQVGLKARTGMGQWLGEAIATFGLLVTIRSVQSLGTSAAAAAIACYIGAAYWFTSSTSFANPAVTVARAMTDTFAGIRPADAPAFVAAQALGAAAALALCRWLGTSRTDR